MIKAVCFDVGSTLLYPSPSVAQTFAHVASLRGHDVTVEQVQARIPAMDAFYEREYLRDGDFWCSREGSKRIWLDQYRYLCRLTGIEHDADGMAEQVHSAFLEADHWAAYDDVVPCLRGLRASGLRLGVVSNWDAGLARLLDGMGLASFFEVVCCSAVLACRKPDPAIFLHACESLGVEPGECVHVGDRPDADGDGAVAAGVRPLIVDRGGESIECAYPRFASLDEVAAAIRRGDCGCQAVSLP